MGSKALHKRSVAFVALAALVIAGIGSVRPHNAYAQEDQVVLRSLARIEKSLAGIEMRLADLEERLAEHTLAEHGGLDEPGAFSARRADQAKLRQIKLPEDPTKEQVRQYLEEIADASSDQNSFSNTDPQVRMLTRVGPENVDVLLEFSAIDELEFYAQFALRKLVGPEHKELVLEYLPVQHELAEIVMAQGWAQDARDTLVDVLAVRPDYLPDSFILAAASLRDKAMYENLVWYLANGNSPEETYEAVKDLPGIELREAVEQVWQLSGRRAEYRRDSMARVAARLGIVDALGEVIQQASGDAPDAWQEQQARRLLWQLTGTVGSATELQEWFDKNRDDLSFDSEKGRYFVRQDGAVQEAPE